MTCRSGKKKKFFEGKRDAALFVALIHYTCMYSETLSFLFFFCETNEGTKKVLWRIAPPALRRRLHVTKNVYPGYCDTRMDRSPKHKRGSTAHTIPRQQEERRVLSVLHTKTRIKKARRRGVGEERSEDPARLWFGLGFFTTQPVEE